MMKQWITTRIMGINEKRGQHRDRSPAEGTPPAVDLSPDALLIDVRSPGEFNSGHIAGAVNLPLDRVESDISGIAPDKSTPLLLYCRSGARSGRACEILSSVGYRSVRNGGGIGSLALQLGRMVNRT